MHRDPIGKLADDPTDLPDDLVVGGGFPLGAEAPVPVAEAA